MIGSQDSLVALKSYFFFSGPPTCALKDYSTHPRIRPASGADWTLATSLCRDMVCRGLTAGLGGVWPLYLSPQQRSLPAPGVSLGHSHPEGASFHGPEGLRASCRENPPEERLYVQGRRHRSPCRLSGLPRLSPLRFQIQQHF